MVKEGDLRPFDPLRDILPVANLIQMTFAEEAREVVLGMRSAAFFGPLLWALSRISAEAKESMLGFVWVENGEVVGNVSLNKGPGSTGIGSNGSYFIYNLAVHPSYRRRGIARRLMDAAIDEARRREGRSVVLEVRGNNAAARSLYERMGFSYMDASSEMCLENLASPRLLPSEWAEIRELRASDREGIATLVREVGLAARPIMSGWDVRGLGEIVTLARTYRWVAEESSTGSIQGAMVLRASRGFVPHRLEMVVHPSKRGMLEEAMLTRALVALKRHSAQKVMARLHPSYDQIRQAFERQGFVELRTLMKMALEIDKQGDSNKREPFI